MQVYQSLWMREFTYLNNEGDPNWPVRLVIHSPVPEGPDWSALFEISGLEGPNSVYQSKGYQVDELGAFLDAAQKAAVILCLDQKYKDGRLFWMQKRDSFGLPVPPGHEDLR